MSTVAVLYTILCVFSLIIGGILYKAWVYTIQARQYAREAITTKRSMDERLKILYDIQHEVETLQLALDYARELAQQRHAQRGSIV